MKINIHINEFINKLRIVNQIRFGVFLSYFNTFITAIFGLLYTSFMLRYLGQSDFGLYSLVTTLAAYFLIDYGLGNAVTRYVAKYRAVGDKESEENFLAICFILYCLLDLIILIVIFISYFYIERIFGKSISPNDIEKFKVMYIISGIASVFSFPLKSMIGAITGYEQFVFPNLMQILNQITKLIVIITLLLLGYKVVALVLANAIIGVLFLVFQLIYGLKYLKITLKLHSFNMNLVKEILRYSFFVYVGMISDIINWKVIPIIIGAISGVKEVAVFSVAIMLANFYTRLSFVISNIYIPRVTTMIANNATPETLTNLMIKIGRIQFIIIGIILCGMISLGKQFIILWAGNQYITSYYISCILMSVLTIPIIQDIGISILYAQNNHSFRNVAMLVVSIFSIFISYFLVDRYNSMGGAYGMSLSYIIGQGIILNIYYHKKTKLDMLKFFRECIFPFILPVFLIIATGYIINHSMSSLTIHVFIIKLLLYIISYLVIMWYLGMNIYEKNLFKSPIEKAAKIIMPSK